MILLDTGLIVALFDPAEDSHRPCIDVLKSIVEPLGTTIPVLTEAFHQLSPGSIGAANLIHFIADSGLAVWFPDPDTLDRAFELMQQYADHPMDLADASLVAVAEAENLHKVFTIDSRHLPHQARPPMAHVRAHPAGQAKMEPAPLPLRLKIHRKESRPTTAEQVVP